MQNRKSRRHEHPLPSCRFLNSKSALALEGKGSQAKRSCTEHKKSKSLSHASAVHHRSSEHGQHLEREKNQCFGFLKKITWRIHTSGTWNNFINWLSLIYKFNALKGQTYQCVPHRSHNIPHREIRNSYSRTVAHPSWYISVHPGLFHTRGNRSASCASGDPQLLYTHQQKWSFQR